MARLIIPAMLAVALSPALAIAQVGTVGGAPPPPRGVAHPSASSPTGMSAGAPVGRVGIFVVGVALQLDQAAVQAPQDVCTSLSDPELIDSLLGP